MSDDLRAKALQLIAEWRASVPVLERRGLYSSSGRVDQLKICADELEAALSVSQAPEQEKSLTREELIQSLEADGLHVEFLPNHEGVRLSPAPEEKKK